MDMRASYFSVAWPAAPATRLINSLAPQTKARPRNAARTPFCAVSMARWLWPTTPKYMKPAAAIDTAATRAAILTAASRIAVKNVVRPLTSMNISIPENGHPGPVNVAIALVQPVKRNATARGGQLRLKAKAPPRVEGAADRSDSSPDCLVAPDR